MPDGRGGRGSDTRTRIMQACEKRWTMDGPNGLLGRADCSGFVKAVMTELGLTPLIGNASGMFDEVVSSPAWSVLGTGGAAARLAAMTADEGRLVLALWKNTAGHGHVAIVVGDMSNALRKEKIEANVFAYWGQFGGDGYRFSELTKSFGATKLPAVRYAAYAHAL